MRYKEFCKLAGELRKQKQKQLNEIYWWVSVSLSSLDFALKEDTAFTDTIHITVPTIGGTKQVKRTQKQIKQVLHQARTIDIYQSVFVFIVAQVEDFFSHLIYLILSTDNRRLKTNIPGIDLIKKFEVDEILDSENKEAIIDKIIRKNLINLFYAGPQKQKEYFEKVLGIYMDDTLWNEWFEFKATRDIIVHNSGIINELYIEKAGENARGRIGDKILVNDKYFSKNIAIMKTIIGRCEVIAKKSLKPQEK